MKKNILFVIDERRMGGVSVLLQDIVNIINIDKYNIDILCLHNNGEMLNNLPDGVNLIFGTKYFEAIDYTYKEVLKSKNLNLILKKLWIILDMKTGKIKNKLKKERVKILQKKYDVEIAFKDGFTALFTAFGNSKKKVHWLHYEYIKTNPNEKYDKLFKKILPIFDKIVAVSSGVKEAFNNIYHLEEKTIVINNLIDTDRIIEKSKEDVDVILDKKQFNAVSVGRLHPMKGYDRLVKILNNLNIENMLPKNFVFRLYGDGPDRNLLENLIVKYHLEGKVKLMGQVMNPYKYIKSSDLFLMPSNYEPFGLVIVESMVLNVPVIATSNAATKKLINHDFNGYIVENSDKGLYNGLKYLFENLDKIKYYKSNLKYYEYKNNKIIKQINEVLDI